MKYFRVRPEFDNVTRYRLNKHGTCIPDSILIGGELYTASERSKIANRSQMFDTVEVPKNKTFYSFGARFEMGQPR